MGDFKIRQAIRQRHSSDLVVEECKNGPTIFGPGHRRLDVWVLKKSWSNMGAIGYEIKVSRQDFLNDNKWHEYLPYCNEFYFVTPFKMVAPQELPDQVGLIWCSQSGARLYTKRKAAFRDIDPNDLNALFRYVLISRVKVIGDDEREREPMTNYWKNWLAERDEKKELGWNVSNKIRELVHDKITKVHYENDNLKEENEKLQNIKRFIEKQGINIKNWHYMDRVKEILGEQLPSELINPLRIANENLTLAIKKYDELEESMECDPGQTPDTIKKGD